MDTQISDRQSNIGLTSLPPELLEMIFAWLFRKGQNARFCRQYHPIFLVSHLTHITALKALACVIRAQGISRYPESFEIANDPKLFLVALRRATTPSAVEPEIGPYTRHALVDYASCHHSLPELSLPGIMRQALFSKLEIVTFSMIWSKVNEEIAQDCLAFANVMDSLREMRVIYYADTRVIDASGSGGKHVVDVFKNIDSQWKLMPYPSSNSRDATVRQILGSKHFQLLRLRRVS